ncbi:MAG TPA: hypothetical protein VFM06_00960 [Candidatus Limnocylindria bacterium]|nr:hypothetical protein [Candidatus Limnocylindria bacterium]
MGLQAQSRSNVPVAEPLALSALIVSLSRGELAGVPYGLVHVAYLLGLALLGATILNVLNRGAVGGRGAITVGLLVGLAITSATTPDVVQKAGLTGLLFALPSGLAEAVVLAALTWIAWGLERRM